MTAEDLRPNLMHLGRPAGAGCGCGDGGECACSHNGRGHYEERGVIRVKHEDAAAAQAAMQEDAQ